MKTESEIENTVMTAKTATTTTTFELLPASERVASTDAADEVVEHLDGIGEMFKIGTSDSFAAANLLETLETERQNWEGTELAASHARLYGILTKCYAYYLAMKSATADKQVRAEMAKGLERFITARRLRTLDKTHDMNRVVKAVFGEDRRRVSAYSMALRVALTAGTGMQPLPYTELSAWIAAQGGVEEIRQGSKNGGKTTAERVEVAKDAVKDKSLMTFKPDPKSMSFDSNDADKMMVLVVTYRPTGDIEVNSVIKSTAAVKAALAAHYAENKGQMADAKARKEMSQPTAVSIALNNNN
jgi:hypothetical protein